MAQARVATAQQAVTEADELLRIQQLKARAGAGLAADEMRAKAALAARQQDLSIALNGFYQASIALSLSFRLDATTTLIPSAQSIPQTMLVRADLPIGSMLDSAIANRPDLKAVRTLVEAAAADRGGVTWGSISPQVQAGYQYGGQ